METATVKLDSFTGPLDLLLHLVRENEVDIHDISIAQIAGQYLKLIEDMQKLDMEIAGEFLLLAAVLAEMKVRQLLPRSTPVDDEELLLEEEGDDPRLELIKQLLRFRFFKERAGLIERLMELRFMKETRPEGAGTHLMDSLAVGAAKEPLEGQHSLLRAILHSY